MIDKLIAAVIALILVVVVFGVATIPVWLAWSWLAAPLGWVTFTYLQVFVLVSLLSFVSGFLKS